MEPEAPETLIAGTSTAAPGNTTRATMADLLDRLLDKGLVVRADLIISLGGVPLIGVSLSAAIAGMETMIQYGMMTDWDASTRACGPRRDSLPERPSQRVRDALVLQH